MLQGDLGRRDLRGDKEAFWAVRGKRSVNPLEDPRYQEENVFDNEEQQHMEFLKTFIEEYGDPTDFLNSVEENESFKRFMKPNGLFSSVPGKRSLSKPNGIFMSLKGKRFLKPNSLFNSMDKKLMKPNSLFNLNGKRSLMKPNGLFSLNGKRALMKPNGLFSLNGKRSLMKPNGLFSLNGKRSLMKPNGLFNLPGKRALKPNGLFALKRMLKPNGLFGPYKRAAAEDVDYPEDIYEMEDIEDSAAEPAWFEKKDDSKFWAVRGKKDVDFWAVRGKKSDDKFYAVRGKRETDEDTSLDSNANLTETETTN